MIVLVLIPVFSQDPVQHYPEPRSSDEVKGPLQGVGPEGAIDGLHVTEHSQVGSTRFDEVLEHLSVSVSNRIAARTNIARLDRVIGGLEPGNSYVVAAPIGGGKSTFALQLAINAAKQKKTVLYLFQEMRHIAVDARIVCLTTLQPV